MALVRLEIVDEVEAADICPDVAASSKSSASSSAQSAYGERGARTAVPQ